MALFISRTRPEGSDIAARLSAAFLALFYTFAAFGAALSPAPAVAQANAYYSAELAQTAEKTRAVAGGVAWRCAETTCVAPKASSRPLRVCRELRRKVGAIVSFSADGERLDPDALTRCNG